MLVRIAIGLDLYSPEFLQLYLRQMVLTDDFNCESTTEHWRCLTRM